MDNKNLSKLSKEIIATQADSVNGEISSKLNQARQQALQNKAKKFSFFTSWQIPAVALAAFAVYFLLPFTQQTSEGVEDGYIVIEQMEMLNQYELIQDLEFYQWLSQQTEQASI
jgi:hypothetical protein